MDDEVVERVAKWAYDAAMREVGGYVVPQPDWDDVPEMLERYPGMPDPRPAWVDGARKAIQGDN